jgi:hypothetical protein
MQPFHFLTSPDLCRIMRSTNLTFSSESYSWQIRTPRSSRNRPPPSAGRPGPAAGASSAAPANASKGPPKRVLIVVGVIALAAIIAGGRMWYRSSNFVETENAYITGHVHPVSARIPGVVTKVLFDDNQIVKAGDVLAELDPADQGVKVEQIHAQIASVQQQIAQADASVEQARPRLRPPAPRSCRPRPTWCAPSRTPRATASCTTPP